MTCGTKVAGERKKQRQDDKIDPHIRERERKLQRRRIEKLWPTVMAAATTVNGGEAGAIEGKMDSQG